MNARISSQAAIAVAAAVFIWSSRALAQTNPSTASTGMPMQGGGMSCCPESGLLKGTMGGVAMGLGAVLLISLIVTLWALSIFLIRRSRVRPGS